VSPVASILAYHHIPQTALNLPRQSQKPP
jgi:hypothetical protein